METPKTTEELLEALAPLQADDKDEAEKAKYYRYVIYARRSTDDEEKQVRSLGDQILECKAFAKAQGLGDPDIIEESESAKEPDIRQKFRAMINDVHNGKYDGIIAWHPDRLARNMKDAGEIIDLLDKRIIKDLKFVSFTFANNTSGKMLLGITFVLSKQYSDQLGDNVSRGNRLSTEEGKYIGRAKHGYRKDAGQFLRPDGDNFPLIENAFRMRVDDKTFRAIAEYLNKHNYMRWRTDGTHMPFRWRVQNVKIMINDPSYTGVIVHGKRSGRVDLTKKYDFKPAVSVENFMRINRIDDKNQFIKLAKRYRRGEKVKADLIRGMVFCAECGEPMSSGITVKRNRDKSITRYFYYRCETRGCKRHKKSVRAKVIIDFVKNFLKEKPFSSKGSYNHYAEEIKKVAAQREQESRSTLISLKAQRKRLADRFLSIKELMLTAKEETIRDTFANDLKDAEKDVVVIETEIKKTEATTQTSKTVPLTYEQFLELMEKMPQTLASIKHMKERDYLIRKMFSNFTVSAKKVEKATLNQPFDELYAKNIQERSPDGIRTRVPGLKSLCPRPD